MCLILSSHTMTKFLIINFPKYNTQNNKNSTIVYLIVLITAYILAMQLEIQGININLYFTDISLSNTKTFIEECIVTSKLNHPNVLSLIGVSINSENVTLLMIMPFMPHGDVRSFVKSKRGDMIEFNNFPKVHINVVHTIV